MDGSKIWEIAQGWQALVGKEIVDRKITDIQWESFRDSAVSIGMHSKASNQLESLRRTFDKLKLGDLRDVVTGDLVAPCNSPLTPDQAKRVVEMGFTKLAVK